MTFSARADVERLLREIAPQVLGVIARKSRDFADAEDAVQEGLIAAARQWPAAGVPTNPRGWLYQVAMRRMKDGVRSDDARRKREGAVATERANAEPFCPPSDAEMDMALDDTLVLLFMCCHPSLSRTSSIALTLRAVGGLTTAEIAASFFVPEATMAQRISRAKQSIKASGVGFSMPADSERASRLSAVLHVLYLIFNEGYTTSAGASLQRTDLSNEAIRIARLLNKSAPGNAESTGLLALMLLTDARRSARTGANGELIPLDEQDRTLWNQGLIAEGIALVADALARGAAGPYQIQAAVAALHDEAKRVEDTDWRQIMALYGLLQATSTNPMVKLSHAIATAMVDGPDAGLRLLDDLTRDDMFSNHYRLHAARAHLYEMSGNTANALESYRAAAAGTMSLPERDYLNARAARLRHATT